MAYPRVKKSSLADVEFVRRGWGAEYWIENSEKYCGKVLVVEHGKRSSFHFHLDKTETMLVVRGSIDLALKDTETGEEHVESLGPGDSVRITSGQPHQIRGAGEGSNVLIEFSTTHDERDAYRIAPGDKIDRTIDAGGESRDLIGDVFAKV